jgi:hypothetical protein
MSSVYDVKEQVIRNLIYYMQQDIKKLKDEIAELKRNQQVKQFIGINVGPNATMPELPFLHTNFGGEKVP